MSEQQDLFNQPDSQAAKILAYLAEGHRLTPLESLRLFGCLRLGARIWDLRKDGHKIQSANKRVGDKHVAEYWMER